MEEDFSSLENMPVINVTPLKRDLIELNRLGESFGRSISSAFARGIVSGRKLSSVLRSLAISLSSRALTAALTPLTTALTTGLTNSFAIRPNAKGNVFSTGRLTPFARGGIVNSPVLFPMRNGAGLMGESGPEAIMPLSRGADGRLGVRAQGSNSVTVNMNISSPDVAGFERSRTQITAMMTKAVQRGQRNL